MSSHPDRDPGPGRSRADAGARLPARLPLLTLRSTVLFPGAVLPVLVGADASERLVNRVADGDRAVAAVALEDPAAESPGAADVHGMGTVGRIVELVRLPNGNLNVVVEGLRRARLADVEADETGLWAGCEAVETPDAAADIELEARMISARRLLQRLVAASPGLPAEVESTAAAASDPDRFCDLVGSWLPIPVPDKQRLLETLPPEERLGLILEQLNHQLQVLELSEKIETEVQGEIDRGQREAYLRERLRAIKRELGEEDDESVEIEELVRRIDESDMPDDVRKVAREEVDRLSRISPAAAEHHVARSYVDWLLDMPWGVYSEERLDLGRASRLLDEEHYDLEKVKARIVEYLAVRKLNPTKKGPILCFIGPPGVGKTSLGRSIAKALDREFVRLSLGGLHDEAEIRGHRRTYVGAMPGRIIQGIKRAGTMNPVFMLDEIDKVGKDFRGDPSAALLEVLDPEQNSSFSDHFLEVDFDLSRVLFIATANHPEGIPDVLRDRMEVLELPGYTAEEKVQIGRRYLVPRQLSEHGLDDSHLQLGDEALAAIVADYTEEAGVREMERQVATICRAIARRVADRLDREDAEPWETVRVGPDDLAEHLGPVRYFNEVAERTAVPGVAVGLAWTAAGGDILFIEATRMRGKGELRLTGQLGEVMKESAQAAMSWLRSHADELEIPDDAFKEIDVHVHVPAGATPKDGPSAGIVILVALASLFTDRPVAADLGMTGELTLRGLVLPVGGIKNKVLAARRAGLRRVMLPGRNRKDLEEVPDAARDDLEILFVTRVPEALELALAPQPPAPRRDDERTTRSAPQADRGSPRPDARS